MDVSGASTNDGASVIQYTSNNGNNQQWSMVSTGDGYYKLINRASGKLLAVQNSSSEESAGLVQQTDSNAWNQMWSLEVVN